MPKGIVLNAEDSGTAENPVVWSAFEREKPRLIGGRRISGWKIWKNNIWMCDLASQDIAEISDLYMNGERQVLARYPNLDPSNPVGSGRAYVAGDVVPMHASDSKKLSDQIGRLETLGLAAGCQSIRLSPIQLVEQHFGCQGS